jgi:hypothetical protein
MNRKRLSEQEARDKIGRQVRSRVEFYVRLSAV